MRNAKHTYQLDLSKLIIVCGFLFIIMVNPVGKTFLTFDNNTCEWVDSLDKETSKEKEISSDFEDENIEYNHLTQVFIYSKISKLDLFFNQENMIQIKSLDIFLPPPELL